MSTMTEVMPDVAAPVTAYHALLRQPSLLEASVEALEQARASRRLRFGDRPIIESLRPNFVRRREYRAAMRAASVIYGASRRLEKAIVADSRLRGELALDPWEERMALASPDLHHPSPTVRLDGFLVRGYIRFVEFNGEQPAGMAFQDEAVRAYDGLPVMQAFRERHAVRTPPLREAQLRTVLRAFRHWGGRGAPSVAIVDWAGVPTTDEFELFRSFFQSRGVPTTVCDPRQLTLHRGRLYADGIPVDLVYRRALMSELQARPDDARALVEACVNGAACFVSSFRAKLLHKKLSFAMLSDERFADLYSAVQRQAIARHVPWTRQLADGATTKGQTRIADLLAFVAANRHSLVLKPNDDYGGHGVVLGWTVGQGEWEAAIAAAVKSPHVVQERIELPQDPFPILAAGQVELASRTAGFDPFVFHGRAFGAMCRLSGSGLQNVTAGQASFVPTYLVASL